MKVGDYVRTISGIERLKKENDNGWFFEEHMIIKPDNIEKYIIKSSPNIIDLIEVGDIVKYNPMMNGYIKKQILCKMIKDIKDLMYFKYQIEHKKANFVSILTKEQFKSMEYRIGE